MHPTIRSGTVAAFAIGDVLCPDASEVLRHAGPELTVRGRILYFSDGGASRDHFAIVEVDGIHMPLIVPVAHLRPDGGAELLEPTERSQPANEATAN